ncbi:DUF2948 family protein [Yoonia sediminilitoris]|uniref:DUF2948 family protein n=1 Tax=Yoonia sediminilitoris TaxID=1286148 RepID=A0A2T6KI39_9RHOB|nr:DUF2948 family protein [Yoonia sediminilitoris]PUB15389.1 Protein of unknown function (DUF2948) [Yoonia sediminilitoris]RCW95999.1 DUF2948 family protein [Yoonia sediminilitoris]
MTQDATFEEGAEKPLRLKALDAEDLTVIAALVQDAVFPAAEMRWDQKARRFALLLNRFRWEDAPKAATRKRPFERVQAVLAIEDVVGVKSQGVDKSDPDMVFSLLSIAFAPDQDGAGRLELTLAGDGVVAVEVEALEVILQDVTRPYVAPSGKAPSHPD